MSIDDDFDVAPLDTVMIYRDADIFELRALRSRYVRGWFARRSFNSNKIGVRYVPEFRIYSVDFASHLSQRLLQSLE